MYNLSDTIAAVCTAPGTGAIAVIRLSGSESWEIINKIFTRHSFTHMQAVHGYIIDNDKVIDEVVVLPYKTPNSYTSEDTVEIFCHGGNAVPYMILDLCLKNGARKASNGEFTYRAFVNGRIDLTEAEAINETINAENIQTAHSASSNLRGLLKKKLNDFREKIFNLLAQIESHIEFPLDVPQTERSNIVRELSNIRNELEILINESKQGQMLRTGIKVSISGVPNVGKSSLLNQLLQNERAIVTSEPGTTRDTVEEKAVIGNLPFVLIDTAGIRNEREILEAEKLGIKRTMNSINNSDIVLVVFDLTKGLCNATKEIIGLLNGKPRIIIGNKIDLVKSDKKNSDKCDVCISAKYGTNLSLLKNILAEKSEMLLGSKKNNDFSHDISINQRQKELLLQCNNSINNAIDAVNKNMPDDIVADELKNSLSKLDEVSGRKINDEIITGIFAKFCIGK